MKIQRALKTGIEFKRGSEVIQRNTGIVHAANTSVCGHLGLFVLKSLTSGEKFQSILNHMRYYDDIKLLERYRSNQRRALFYQSTTILDPITHYIYNWIHKIIHYREVSHAMQLMLFLFAMISAIEITMHQLENVNVTVKC